MYLSHYGLTEQPFELTANPKFLFLAPGHREALSNLQYGLSTSKAVTLLIGEAGTGKTTLLRGALESEACRHVKCVVLNNPALTRNEFLETLAYEFDLGTDAGSSKANVLTLLEARLLSRRAAGETTALVVDEAQTLSLELLEEIRLLANIETPDEKLLPVVLAGQPELAARLNEPELRQLKQRVALRCEVQPFSLQETASYIANRIKVAGGDASRVFTREAVVLIHERSHGIARTISVICDNALLAGFAVDRQPVGRELVAEVCDDLDLGGHPAPAPAIRRESASPAPVAARPIPVEDAAPADDAAAFRGAPADERRLSGLSVR
jgi:general secretion pathway protein A